MRKADTVRCWRRSLRGRDRQMTSELDPGSRRPLSLSPVLGPSTLLTIPTVGAEFKDVALREQCGTKTVWSAYGTEPH